MPEPVCYEQYPPFIVILSNLVPILIYLIGAYILFQSGILWAIGYVLVVVLLEFRLLGKHCVDCYYYGRTCAFGKGRLSSLFFKKGQPERFNQKTITAKDLIPDFLVFIVPVLAGILLLVQKFSWIILGSVVALLLLGFAGNALVRGQLACRYCRQKEIGCPAQQMFDKKQS